MIEEADVDLINFFLSQKENTSESPVITNISLLNPNTVSQITKIFVKIISHGLETEKSSLDKTTLDQTLHTIQSWCQIDFNESHRMLTESTLKVFCKYLTESLPQTDSDNYEFLYHCRLCIGNSVKKERSWKEEVDTIYNKKLRKLQLVERRKSINLLYEESSCQSFSSSQTSNRTYNYRKITEIDRRNKDDYSQLAVAVKNLENHPNLKEIFKRLTSYVLIHCNDLNQIKDLQGKDNIDFQIFIMETQVELIESEILRMIQTVIDKIKLTPNYEENHLKNSIYEVVKSTSFFNLALTYYHRSRRLFTNCINIFNHIFIKSQFDLRILYVIDLFLNIIKNQLKQKSITELYPLKFTNLAFAMELFSDPLCSKLVSLDDILQNLSNLDKNCRADCILLLSHYPKIINHYKETVSNVQI